LARTETHVAGKNVHELILRVCWAGSGIVLADRQGTGQALHTPSFPPQARSACRRARFSASPESRDSGFAPFGRAPE
jgi:hypothetical protein